MPITFLDEEEEETTAQPPTGGRRITFLDEEEPPVAGVDAAPAPEVSPEAAPKRKITFLDEEPVAGFPQIPEAPKITPVTVEPSESFLRPVADPFLNIGAGINDVVKGFSDAFGADNPVSQNLAKNSEWYRSLLSAGAKQDSEEIGRIMQEAEGKGVLAEIGAGLKALSVAPVDLVAQGIGSLIPFVATAGLGKAVGLSKAGIAVLQGVQGGLVGGGIVKGEIYSAVKEQLIASGVDEDQAEKAANEAQAYNGKNLDQILLGVGLGVAASATGAEGAIRGLIARKVGKEAAEQVSERAIQEVLRTGFVRGAVKDGIVEAATEALQGGQERLAANIALGREGFEVEPMRGVVAQATLEGALGGILGGVAGGVSAKAEQLGMRESVALRDAAKAAQEAKQSNAPASASAVEDQIEQVGEALNIPATVPPRREGETDQEWRARIERERAETPEQRLARLREEERAGAEITLEEEDAGLAPTEPTPPVEPTVTPPVAPVEPVVTPEVAEPQPATEVAPTEPVAPETNIASEYRSTDDPTNTLVSRLIEGERDFSLQIGDVLDATGISSNPNVVVEDVGRGGAVVYTKEKTEIGKQKAEQIRELNQEYNIPVGGMLPSSYHRRLGEILEYNPTEIESFINRMQERGMIRPEAAPAVTPPAEVAPIPEVTPETPNLEPLRRVARAEQAPEDVPTLVEAGLVEVYKDQPVITEAGLAALPEAERPRLTPEARKIQIDTGASEAAAEAISKGLRIGVDQVPVNVQMPAGWTLEGDVYVPPTPQEVVKAEEPAVTPKAPEIKPITGDLLGQYRLREDEQFSPVKSVPINDLTGKQYFVDRNIVEDYKKRILAGEAIDPIIAKTDFTVLDGYHRSEALQELGFTEIPVTFVEENESIAREEWAEDYPNQPFPESDFNQESKAYRQWQAGVAPAPEVRESRREDIRLNPLGYDITTVVEDIKSGRTDGPLRAVNNVIKQAGQLRDRVQREAARRQQPRARGKAAILDRLSRERAAGRISEETAQALTDFVNRIREDAIGDTALSIRKGGVSNFNFGESLVSFFLNQDQPATGARVGIHEFFHGLSRFLPDTEVEQMRQDYTKNLAEYLKKNPWFLAFVGRYSLTPEQFEAYKLFNPKEAETKLQPVRDNKGNIVKYQIKYDADNYRYIMLDEWIAEKMTDLVRKKQAVPDTFMGKIAKVIRDFLDLIKARLGKDAYESFYQTITDPKQKLNLYRMSSVAEPFQIYEPTNFNYAEDVLDRIRYTRTERDPIITQAAMDLKDGKIDRDEYQRIVDLRMPLEKFENVPIPASKEDIDRGLGNRTITRKDATGKESQILKRDLAQDPESIGEGTIVESRLDIPAYENENVWVVSMHKPRPNLQKGAAGEVIAYTPTAVLRNVEFGVTEPAAINIAAGKPKSTIATMKGSYVPMTAQQAYDLANRGRSEGWVEIGMNPIRHSYFYDKDTQSPVVSAEEVVQVGGMVLAKNPVYGKRDDYRFMALGGEEAGRFPTFETTSPEAATLSTMQASMAKVDAASEAKPNPENKPTYKISEIASVWMDQGGDARQLQDMVVEYTNLSPANAKKVANAIAKQYGIQQEIALAATPEVLPETVTPEAEDRRRPKTTIQRVLDAITGVRVPPVKITANEKTLLKEQIKLKAAAYRDAKKAQQETAAEMVEAIKEMDIRGPIRPKQVAALMKRAVNVNFASETSVDKFIDYAAKVIENANYDRDVAEAKAAQKRAKEIAKRKNVAGPQKQVLNDIAKIEIKYLTDPREFAEAANYYMRAFKSPISEGYQVIPDKEMNDYLNRKQEETKQGIIDADQAYRERLAEKYGVPIEEVNAILDAEDVQAALVQYAKREGVEGMINEKVRDGLTALQRYNTAGMTQKQQELVQKILDLDIDGISTENRIQLIRDIDNILVNGQTNGVQRFVAAAEGQSNAFKASKNKTFTNQQRAWINILFGQTIGKKTRGVGAEDQKEIALSLQSIADTFRNIFGKKNLGLISQIMGFGDLLVGNKRFQTDMREATEETTEFFNKLEKKYGVKVVSDNEGKIAEGVTSYLIQQFPLKTEEESIITRRSVIMQDVQQKRLTGDSEAVAEADIVASLLERIDGDSVQEILNNLKREFPANYEAVMWYKDTFLPKYKQFLKEFDENFNNQANNYDNPNYLPIAYMFAKDAELSPDEQRKYYSTLSLTPKQAANSIKRQDYENLPSNKGKPAAISYNLRNTVYSSLSDQLKKAHTSAAWAQIQGFVNSKAAIEVFGNEANRGFMARRLELLQDSQDRRGYQSDGFSKVLDSVAIFLRRIGIGIGLGGVGQVIKQAPDQIVTTIANTGDPQLSFKNLMIMMFTKDERADAMKLMSKFSIGERGDAAMGGAQFMNPLESGFSNLEKFVRGGQWARIKDTARRISDVWLIALKKSDFWAASSGWMTYYQKKLEEEGGIFTDWANEAKLVDTDPVRQRAAYHAELMIDLYQGSSDPTRMARLSQRGKSGYENAWKGLFLAFNSFVLQQRVRMHSDLGEGMSKQADPESAKLARRGLSGTIAGILLFHLMRRYALPAISGTAAYGVYIMLGIDPEEPDEEQKKADADFQLKRFYSEVASNVLVGGFGSIVEQRTLDALNQGAYMLSRAVGSDWVLDDQGETMDFAKWKKDKAPFWYYQNYKGGTDLGIFGIGFDQLANAQDALRKATDPELRDTLTTEEQRLLSLAAFSEILYLARLNDADVDRMFSRMAKETLAAAKEREAELRAIRNR